MLNAEFRTFVLLTYGSPHTNPEHFIRSLPNEVADKALYPYMKKTTSLDFRRDIAIRYCNTYSSPENLNEVLEHILPTLYEYHNRSK